ncbi:mannose-6-phosphate isomerase [Tritrichomonas foetus]|uniref:Mannose-6-phosphate isomerase n=1 Tax=Tritrichomonas foetus TaxID=1144522 RepID=A0A1J4J2N2_9EUKA|nr:mannose-6-phosphate isomerase [Tritrichomonas foetus]|eukprot:OHS92993.1 mannose-6-phosphate isomerase [Tritrichomonas foetus]
MNTIPEFKGLLSNNTLDNFLKTPSEDSIKAVLHELLELKYEDHKEKFLSFTQNYHNYGLDENTVHGIDLIVKYFPKDVGIFIPLILNVIVSEPGQALLIPTGTLHAYLEGDLIEAMALSDNVIRAAMTPKFVDVENLFKVMNFKPQGPQYLEGQSNQEGVFYFPTGFSSFNLESGKIAEGKKAKINKKFDASIIAVLNGTVKLNGEEYKSGSTVLIMPQTELEIESLSGTAEFYICSSK